MSSWIESLKSYHTEQKSKYRIPKKDSEEYQTILKYHQNRIPKISNTVPKKNINKVAKTSKVIENTDVVKPKRVYKKKPKNLVVDTKLEIKPTPEARVANDGNTADDEAFTDDDE